MKFEIPGSLPGMNEIIEAAKSHGHAADCELAALLKESEAKKDELRQMPELLGRWAHRSALA